MSTIRLPNGLRRRRQRDRLGTLAAPAASGGRAPGRAWSRLSACDAEARPAGATACARRGARSAASSARAHRAPSIERASASPRVAQPAEDRLRDLHLRRDRARGSRALPRRSSAPRPGRAERDRRQPEVDADRCGVPDRRAAARAPARRAPPRRCAPRGRARRSARCAGALAVDQQRRVAAAGPRDRSRAACGCAGPARRAAASA